MWGLIDDYLRSVLILDDETLLRKSKRKNEGGGLIFLGICLIIMGIAHQLFFEILYDSKAAWIAVSCVVILLGIICTVFGIRIFNQKGQSVAESWAERNGYTVEEIQEFNRECRMDSALVIHSDYFNSYPFPESVYQLKKENALETGFITEHWFKAPDTVTVEIMRLIDIAAIWYEPKELGGKYEGVYYVKSNGKREYFRSTSRFGNWLVEEISKRNPMTITAGKFESGGVEYNAYKDAPGVARLYCSEFEKRRQTS